MKLLIRVVTGRRTTGRFGRDGRDGAALRPDGRGDGVALPALLRLPLAARPRVRGGDAALPHVGLQDAARLLEEYGELHPWEQLHAADRAAWAQTSAAYGRWAALQQGEGDDAAVAAAEATYHEAARIEARLQSDWFAGLSRADMVQMGDGVGVRPAEQL